MRWVALHSMPISHCLGGAQAAYLLLHPAQAGSLCSVALCATLADTDGGPTKQAVEAQGEASRYWQLCFGKRPADELYNLKADADCVRNLADDPAYKQQLEALREKLFSRLRQQGDPRMEGKGDVFDNYPSPYPAPQRVGVPVP
jgi:hypothetical protein